jgi:hypothetical protein
VLGWQPEMELEDGLRRTWEWFVANADADRVARERGCMSCRLRPHADAAGFGADARVGGDADQEPGSLLVDAVRALREPDGAPTSS